MFLVKILLDERSCTIWEPIRINISKLQSLHQNHSHYIRLPVFWWINPFLEWLKEHQTEQRFWSSIRKMCLKNVITLNEKMMLGEWELYQNQWILLRISFNFWLITKSIISNLLRLELVNSYLTIIFSRTWRIDIRR